MWNQTANRFSEILSTCLSNVLTTSVLPFIFLLLCIFPWINTLLSVMPSHIFHVYTKLKHDTATIVCDNLSTNRHILYVSYFVSVPIRSVVEVLFIWIICSCLYFTDIWHAINEGTHRFRYSNERCFLPFRLIVSVSHWDSVIYKLWTMEPKCKCFDGQSTWN